MLGLSVRTALMSAIMAVLAFLLEQQSKGCSPPYPC